MSEPLMPRPGDQQGGPSAEDLDLEVALDEQGGGNAADTDELSSPDVAQDDDAAPAAQGDPSFITPQAGESLSPEQLRRES